MICLSDLGGSSVSVNLGIQEEVVHCAAHFFDLPHLQLDISCIGVLDCDRRKARLFNPASCCTVKDGMDKKELNKLSS